MIAPNSGQVSNSCGATFAALLLALLVLLYSIWAYWPGISGPDLLDDRTSVMVMDDLQDNPERALDRVFGDKSGLLGRSVSVGSFVLEKLYFDAGIAGNKKVNIILHALTGCLVIWLFWLLFRFLVVPGYALLAVVLGALWLLHPLLVSTVLYVVQRMAMLSTFFMLLSTISYVYWRLGLISGSARWLSGLRLLAVIVFFGLALFSKENAIVLIPTLLLMEVLWFECIGQDGRVIRWLRHTSYALIATGSVALLVLLIFQWGSLAARFRRRDFSLQERLFTETRIVWDYVGQLFGPQVQRMGLYHDDVVLSQGLTAPLTTLYAVLAWLLVAVVCAVLLRWREGRWLVFGVAWFVVGHSIESTVWPLELYYEHRNYFPAIGFALMLGALFAIVVKKWPEPRSPLLVCLGICVLILSAQTSSQVQIWSNRSLLILSHLNGHPNSNRANIDMAEEMASWGEAEAAHRYSRRAFEASKNGVSARERNGDYEVRNLALSCIANKPVAPELIDNLGKQDPERPLSSVTTLLSLVRLLQDNRCPQLDRIRLADRLATLYLVDDFRQKAAAKIYLNLAVLENALQRYDNAYAYAEQFLSLSGNDKMGLLMKLHFAAALGKTEAAEDVIAILQKMDKQGELTVKEQQTLALYLESEYQEN